MRTVITVDPSGYPSVDTQPETFVMKVERHSSEVPFMSRVFPFEMAALPGWDTPNAVSARGCLLRDALRKHPGIAGVLDSLGTAPPGSKAPIYVKLSEGDAELIGWETLCDAANKFVALDKRWPIGRITDPASTIPRTPSLFRLPVKIIAVISAHGIAGQQREWGVLRDAADAAINAGLPVEVRVLTGDPAVQAQVTSDIAAARPWASVAGIEEYGVKVLSGIAKWQPNIVHFFCHGRAGDDAQQLELARGSDFLDATLQRGSVTISGDELAAFGENSRRPGRCSGGLRPNRRRNWRCSERLAARRHRGREREGVRLGRSI